MARGPAIARTIATLDRAIGKFRAADETVALVPTMGALHAGHVALIERARRKADRVVVSIFVNPAQFAPHEDFTSYPRPFDADVAALREHSVDLVWAPTLEAIVEPEREAGLEILPAGAPTVMHWLMNYTRRVAKLFVLALVMIGFLHYRAFRTLQGMIVPLVTAIMGVIWALGLMGRRHGRFRRLPFASGWTDGRDLPAPEGDTFFARYAREQRAGRSR